MEDLPSQSFEPQRELSTVMSPSHEDVAHSLSKPGSPLGLRVGLVDHVLARPQRISELLTIEDLAHRIRTDTGLSKRTSDLRAVLASGGREGRYRKLKEKMPAVLPAVAAPTGTAVKGVSTRFHNGMYGFDLDEGRESLEKSPVIESLICARGCVLVGTSCAGDALYAIFAGPKAKDHRDYILRWEAIAAGLPSGAKAASGRASKNFNRLRFLCYDPDLWVASRVEPLDARIQGATQTMHERRTHGEDTAVHRDALSWINPPGEYNDWFGWLPTLKALGFTVEEVEEWSKRGHKYREGEVALRWFTLPDDEPNAATDKLLGHAHKSGWRRPSPTPLTGPSVNVSSPRPPLPEGLLDALRDEFLSGWQKIALVCADRIRPRYRYDRKRAAWWTWDGNHWIEVENDFSMTDSLHSVRLRLAADLLDCGEEDLARLLYKDNQWQGQTGNRRGEWWAKLRDELDRPAPAPPQHELATPRGVIDLRSGRIESHDPLKHDTLAVTKGEYRPEHALALREALWGRLQHNIQPGDFDQLLKALGVAVARRSVDYGGILWLFGASGGGKGSTARLIQIAFGMQGVGVSADLLERRSRSDIDADLARLIQIDPVVYVASEIERVGTSRINSVTGGDVHSARKPHGKIAEGALSGMLIATSVDAPSVSVEKGLERRIIVIYFPRKLGACPILSKEARPTGVEKQRNFTQEFHTRRARLRHHTGCAGGPSNRT